MLTAYTRDELNQIATCIDIALKSQGVVAGRVLMPLYEKTEQIAKEMDAMAKALATPSPQ